MSVFAPYAQALVRFVPKVYGRRLRPLQLGHMAALDMCGNTLACGGVLTVEDVLQAAWLCSRSGAKALASLDDARTEKLMFRFAARNARADHAEAEAEMLAYWGYYMTTPERWDDGKKADLRAPVAWLLYWRLAGKRLPTTKVERNALWNTPANQAACWVSVANACEGDDSLISEVEAKAMEDL